MFKWFSNAHPLTVSTPAFEAVIAIIGEPGAGKSTLINLIAGKPITDTPKSTDIWEYTCTYHDKATHFTWKLHLLDTPGFVDDYRDEIRLHRIQQRLKRKHSNINGIIYCRNINQDQFTGLSSRLIRPFKELREDQVIKNFILCTTQWDMLMDKSVGEHKFQELKKDWKKVFDPGAHFARHDNTRQSVEEMLGLIIGKDALKLLLLKELGSPQMTDASKATFRHSYEEAKRLLQEIRSTHIKETADREIREDEESLWQQKFAHMSAQLDSVKTAQEKRAIERRMEMEDQELKRKLRKAIQRASEERIERDNAKLSRRLTEPTGLNSIANPACAAHNEIGDAPISSLKLSERALLGDGIEIEGQKQGHSGEGSATAIGLSGTHDSPVDNHAINDANDENSDSLVPLQFKPFTDKYVITPELASKTFQNVNLLLDAVNKIFDTNIPISYPGVGRTLEYLINKGHDLGTVYAHMQVIWPTSNIPSISSKPFTDKNSDYVIASPELAFRKCQDVDELLSFLNISFHTKIPRSKPGVDKVLRFLVDQGYEFGDICAHMRHTWPRTPKLEKKWLKVWKLEQMTLNVWEDFLTLERRGEEYEDQRQKSLHHDTIHEPNLIKPRRIWDLYAHRVIPYQFSVVDANRNNYNPLLKRNYVIPARLYFRFGSTRLGRYHPVSHSWTEDMSPVDSPVNAYEWPVPLPRGVTLEAVRNELLNLGAQYVWLDVVCLRQESSVSTREALRMEEWKIDVPTIGKVYKASPWVDNVIRYLNGLGKMFKRNGWQDKRHWSQRAWTLQELSERYIEAGLPKGVEDLLELTSDDSGVQLRDHLKTGEIRLGQGQHFLCGTDLHDAIAAMKVRHSQNPVDKIFGLCALLECTALLAYLENEQEEHAWARLVRNGRSRIWAELLFACPLPGENGCYWRPSWRQLMVNTGVIEKMPSLPYLSLPEVGDHGRFGCRMALIKGCQVSFNCSSASNVVVRTERGGKKYEWTMIGLNPHLQDLVPGILYTLAGCNSRPTLHWVLCKPYPCSRELEKVSVFRRSPDEIQGSDVIGIGLDRLEKPGCADSERLMCHEYVVFR